ncbi:MAG: efflux RND transporter periplasmic adaptor subunit [Hyphomicrobiaceae bacterium]|nr:efflux RND transporter periplasmic adaptor subunit [Hyphomicrobiaceae bacterium]
MKSKLKALLFIVALVGAGAGAAYVSGFDVAKIAALVDGHKPDEAAHSPVATELPAPAITVAKAETQQLTETALVTGTLVPREEVLVSPEVEGLRITDLKVDVGDRVKAGDILATLEQTQLETQLAQNTAAIARADAMVAQANSQIAQAEAAATEAAAQLERATPLKKSGYLSESVYDQRAATARTTEAQRAAAEDGLKLAQASKQEAEAQRREILWRLGNTDVKAPRGGIVSRRTARIGALASGTAEPMFRIIADGEIELEADVIEGELARIKPDQTAVVSVDGVGDLNGKVRLVAPEIDRATRLGKVKIFIGDMPGLRIGAFGRARIATAESRGVTVPASAVLYSQQSTSVLLVKGDRVELREVKTGLRSNGQIEIIDGLREGDVVVAKSGTFLRDGDKVRPVTADTKVSEAR